MQMRGMGGESPFSCFDIIHLNIIRCVIRTPVIGQIFMLLDSFNFKFYCEIFKHPKSMGLLTQFEISQLLNSNFCFKIWLWKRKKRVFQLCRCCVKIKYLSVFVCGKQTETHSKHLNGKPIENDCFFFQSKWTYWTQS